MVRRIGATPRDAGAKIFIEESGELFETIGGGCVEAEAWREAQMIFESGIPKLFHYAMNGQQIEDEGMICGGSLDIFMEPVLVRYQKLYEAIVKAKKKGQRALIVTRFDGHLYAKTLITTSGEVIGDELDPGTIAELMGNFNEKKPKLLKGLVIEPAVPSSVLYIY